MANVPRYKVAFRRRREGRTDYSRRRRLIRGGVPRAVVRRSLKHTSVQFIDYDEVGDKVAVSAHSRELRDMGWQFSTGNLPAAYLTGYLAGKKAMAVGIDEAVLDIGLREPIAGSLVFATLKGMVDAGLYVPHSDDVLPSEERLMGNHIGDDVEVSVREILEKMEAD